MERKVFKCPLCGKEENVANAHERSILTELDSQSVDLYRYKITQQFYIVRFCSSCDNRMRFNHILRHLLYFVPLIIIHFINPNNGVFEEIQFLVFFYLPSYLLAVFLYRKLKANSSYTRKLINRAKEGNAIVPEYEFYRRALKG